MSRISFSTIVRRCLRLIRQAFWKHNTFESTTFQKLDVFEDRRFFITKTGSKHDGIEARRENPKSGKNPNFGIMKFFEEARDLGNIFHQGCKSLSLELAGRVSGRTGLGRRVNFMTLAGLSLARHVALPDHGVGLDGQSCSCLIVGWPVGLSSPTLGLGHPSVMFLFDCSPVGRPMPRTVRGCYSRDLSPRWFHDGCNRVIGIVETRMYCETDRLRWDKVPWLVRTWLQGSIRLRLDSTEPWPWPVQE
ncbi:hypothetical protein F2Q68_00038420 [Brassica cretica]|uniref:Uncharacterized protein n=1 Tax=Brassica cretica TaxID=69181 RepID=A0A8S9MHY3_BRACR|nr:hypothetical protein F2Q68_00038420 [Brassica cretica]